MACFGFSVLANLLMLTAPLYMMQVYDSVLQTGSRETLAALTGIAVGALVVLGLLDAIRRRILVRAAHWLEDHLALPLAQRQLEAATTPGGKTEAGSSDLGSVRGCLAGPAVIALFDLPLTPLFVFVLFLLHPLLGAVAVGAALILALLAVFNDLVTRQPSGQAGRLAQEARQWVWAGTRNARTLDALGMAGRLLGRWGRAFAGAQQANLAAGERGAGIAAASKALRLMAQVAILACGAMLVIDEATTPGAMIAASMVMARALAPLEQSIAGWRQLTGAVSAYRRIQRSLQGPGRRSVEMSLPAPSGRISLDNVSYTPPSGKQPILQGISVEIEPGLVVALVGRSGSGKSTLARLLVGIDRPDNGHVRLDGAEVFQWSREALAAHVGYLPQEVELLGTTVADAIGRLGDAGEDEVIAASQRAGAHEAILALPEGYHTALADDGLRLSGGQRQMIALARAMLGRPRLVVLDEATAHLDSYGQAALARAVATLKQEGATVVVIGHHASTLAQADRVLVLERGRLAAFGRPDEIFRRPEGQQSGPGRVLYAGGMQ